MLSRFLALAFCVSANAAVIAHEGHGDPNHADGVMHYVVNPSHASWAIPVIVVAVSMFYAVRKYSRKSSDQ